MSILRSRSAMPEIDARRFGAIGDGVADDTAAINAALTASDCVYLPAGTYAISGPIYLGSGKTLRGDGRRRSEIIKTANTAGTGSNDYGGETDSYAINAAIIIPHSDESYASRVKIEGVRIVSDDFVGEYGIYAPRLSQSHIEDVEVLGFRYGFVSEDAWMLQMSSVVYNGDSIATVGVPDIGAEQRGWEDAKGVVINKGTSLGATNVWVRNVHIAWTLINLGYSSLNACGADNNTGQSYYIQGSTITLNGCGMENTIHTSGLGCFYAINSYVTANGLRSYKIYGRSSGTGALVGVAGSKVTLENCRLDDFETANNGFNLAVQEGAHLRVINSALPENGNSYISYSGGATLTEIEGDQTVIRSSEGSRFIYPTTTATTAELEDVTDTINTMAGKRTGREVFNSTTGKPVYASGSADGSVWKDATGATAHTPV